MKPWENVVRIPEGQSGTYRIEHFTCAPGPVPRSNRRTALIGGQSEPPLHFKRETHWHRLRAEDGVWMTDLPIEQTQHDRELEPVRSGDVLIGGLGLGYAVNVLARRKRIDEIVVVERSEDVIKLVEPYLIDPQNKVRVVHADLFNYLRSPEAQDRLFDHAFFDIWREDSLETLFNFVTPLRRLAEEHSVVETGKVICWNENVMRGQLLHQLWGRALQLFMPPLPGGVELTVDYLVKEQPGNPWHNWAIPFWIAMQKGRFTLGEEDRAGEVELDASFQKNAGEYAGTWGHPGWKVWWALKHGLDL